MVTQATKADWQQGQDALREETQRVTALLRSIKDPGAPAVGTWNLGEVAMHLSQDWLNLPGLARRDLSRVREVLPEIDSTADSMMKDVWEMGDVMNREVKNDPERDLSVLADRIDAEAEKYFSECAGADPNDPRPWMVEGMTFPLSTLTFNLLNETLIHGYDIARAAGRKWTISPSHATMALERLVFPIFQAAPPRIFTNEAKAAGVRATYDVRLRGGNSVYFIFDDGNFTVEEPSSRTVDCHISADPVALLLVSFNRQSQWSAIARGKLLAWGRKPWLGPQLRGLLRNP